MPCESAITSQNHRSGPFRISERSRSGGNTNIIEFLPKGVRLAVSPLSWANDVLEDLGADISLETCLADAVEVGYQGVELGRKFPRNADVLRPILGNYGLSLASGWHSGELAERNVDEEMAAVASHANLLRTMGCEVMVYGEVAMMPPGPPLDQPMSRRMIMAKEDVPGYATRLAKGLLSDLPSNGVKFHAGSSRLLRANADGTAGDALTGTKLAERAKSLLSSAYWLKIGKRATL